MAHDDTLKKLGKIQTSDQGRDAIHIACLTMQAKHQLCAGDWVNADGLVVDKLSPHAVGIVDPFLKRHVSVGEWFYVYLKPASITGLQHVWTHPAFPDVKSISQPSTTQKEAEARVRTWCREISYEDFLEVLQGNSVESEDYYGYRTGYKLENWGVGEYYLMSYGSDAHGEIPPEILDDVEIILGKKLTIRPTGFSCSC